MGGPGDIPIVSGAGSRPAPASEGLVWVVDGQEQPFSDASEGARPWLEDSFDWAEAGSVGEPPDDDDPAPDDSLVWL